MVVYVVVTSFLRNVAFLIYALFGEISILEIPVVGNFSLFAGLVLDFFAKVPLKSGQVRLRRGHRGSE